MRNLLPLDDLPQAKGIQRSRALPDAPLGELWDSIKLEEGIKERLLSQAILNFTLRPKVARSVLPMHGAILLVGAPGTGKTSLAKGLANRVSQLFKNERFRLLEVEPHMLTSSNMGKTQRAVSDLFSQTIAEAAALGPTIVLLDEVETLAADRTRMSLEANPIDIHRATDAVLVQLDALAEQYTNILFLATSNFPEAVDQAFTSRCDLVMTIPLPSADACREILLDCLSGLAATFPALDALKSGAGLNASAKACVGLDGRAIRKMVASALTFNKETAIDPSRLTHQDLLRAAQAAKAERAGGRVA
ncbi:cell division protein [Stenotrophomonas maltophilia]|nr:cell division protein [Stenotrophomonas maltophilia]